MAPFVKKSKIAIAGAGMTGAYLYRLLSMRGREVDLFDPTSRTTCGLTPCAWGTSRGFHELVRESGLNPESYILQRPGHIWMDEVRIKADLMTFDKPRLIRDLLHGVRIRQEPLEIGRYDRVVDATGQSRVYLPPIERDLLLPCVQYRVKTEKRLENRIRLGGVGYAWCFPLSEEVYHIGCGSLRENPGKILESLRWLNPSRMQIQCGCAARIRLTGPRQAGPFVANTTPEGIWGVGEAIGCVAPLAGDGIVTGMETVRLLLQHWNDPEAYAAAVLQKYAWMEEERRVVDRLLEGGPLGPGHAWVLKKNSRRMGMRIGIKDAVTLLMHLK
jgi:flavin-dependent dehydrogenase